MQYKPVVEAPADSSLPSVVQSPTQTRTWNFEAWPVSAEVAASVALDFALPAAIRPTLVEVHDPNAWTPQAGKSLALGEATDAACRMVLAALHSLVCMAAPQHCEPFLASFQFDVRKCRRLSLP